MGWWNFSEKWKFQQYLLDVNQLLSYYNLYIIQIQNVYLFSLKVFCGTLTFKCISIVLLTTMVHCNWSQFNWVRQVNSTVDSMLHDSMFWQHVRNVYSKLKYGLWRERLLPMRLKELKVAAQLFGSGNCVFSILYYINWTSRIRWIQLESVKHDWRLLKAFLCLILKVGSVGVMVMTPDWESVGWEYKNFKFFEEKS